MRTIKKHDYSTTPKKFIVTSHIIKYPESLFSCLTRLLRVGYAMDHGLATQNKRLYNSSIEECE